MQRVILTVTSIALFCTTLCSQGLQQKPPLDTSALEMRDWSMINSYLSASYYGNYIGYNYTTGNSWSPGPRTFVIQNTRTGSTREFKNSFVFDCLFSHDEKQAFFHKNDTLVFLDLENNNPARSVPVRSFKTPVRDKTNKWLAYEEKGNTSGLELINMSDNGHKSLGPVLDYHFSEHGKALLFEKPASQEDSNKVDFYCLDLDNGEVKKIWTGNRADKLEEVKTNEEGRQLLLRFSSKSNDHVKASVWYYELGTELATLKVSDDDPILKGGQVGPGLQFSINGKWICFYLLKPNSRKPIASAPNVDVWSYKDIHYEPDGLHKRVDGPYAVPVMLSLDKPLIRELESTDEQLRSPFFMIPGDVVLIMKINPVVRFDQTGKYFYPSSYYTLSLSTGEKKLIRQDTSLPYSMHSYSFSPDGNWLVYYDLEKQEYFSFNIPDGRIKRFTGSLSRRFVSDWDRDMFHYPVSEVIGWTKDSKNVLLYDNYDIWSFDPSGNRAPNNITHGYGEKHHIKLRLPDENDLPRKTNFSEGDTLLLTGFNTENKYNGFLFQVLGSKEGPALLSMGPYLYQTTYSQRDIPHNSNAGMIPVKAAGANCWFVTRQSAKEAPNFFISDDLKTFRQLSHSAPQATHNWLTTGLLSYTQLDGKPTKGILYKPENFDSTKKYPVIIHFYERKTAYLYEFLTPDWTHDEINIPWFVSNGYLVFTPDIYYTIGKPGRSAYNSVVAAAGMLSKFSFVDPKRMAIQGHSFGGTQTSYIAANSNLFAAAISACGSADMISFYGTNNWNNWTRASQGRMASLPSLAPDLYIKESPVLRAAKVTTPLVFLNTGQDRGNYENALEFFRALYDLHKKAWMLEYNDYGHSVWGKESVDFTLRITQFLDHYLKGYPPPRWMTKGIPGNLKGLELGYEPDPQGECGPDCPVCKKKEYKK